MDNPHKAGAIIVAAGEGRRMSGIDKVFTLLDGKPVLSRVAQRLNLAGHREINGFSLRRLKSAPCSEVN